MMYAGALWCQQFVSNTIMPSPFNSSIAVKAAVADTLLPDVQQTSEECMEVGNAVL